jgi:putative Ca2+/H+ antiporter (TMEM165/GDT1 family)
LLDLAVVGTVFPLIFVAELPDKSALASLVLGTKYRLGRVFTGVAAAFLAHVVIAVAAGSLLTLLPDRAVEAVVAALFLLGAVLLWVRGAGKEAEDVQIGAPAGAGFAKVAGLTFSVIFVAEWGDLTQILTANLAARYDDPIAVGVGATLGLWAVGLIAILGGKSLLRVVPIVVIVRGAAVVMAGLAGYSIYRAVSG